MIRKIFQYVIIAMVVIAIWQGFNGNLTAIIDKAVEILQAGAAAITSAWQAINNGAKD